MKIRLDEREIVAIVEEWARLVHKTKDVSSVFKMDITPEEVGPRQKLLKKATLNQIYIDLDVMIADKGYGNALDSTPTHEAVKRAKQAMMANGVGIAPPPETYEPLGPEPTFNGPPVDNSAVILA